MKAIIPAAGYGTRMLPITKTIPKEMLPVWNKPVIQYIVEWLAWAWIRDIVMITSQWKWALEDYFDKNYELEMLLQKKNKTELLELINKPKNLANMTFIKQKEQLGRAHAACQAEARVNEEFFLVSLGDNFFQPEFYKEIIQLHLDTWNPVYALEEKPHDEIEKYGVVKIVDNVIVDMVEKPKKEYAPSNLIMTGVYIFPKAFFEYTKSLQPDDVSGEFDVGLVFKKLFEDFTCLPYISPYKMRDVGSRELRLQANIDIVKTSMY